MQKILLITLFAIGVGFATSNGASAASIGSGIVNAAPRASIVDQIGYRCRMVKVCRTNIFGVRRCHWDRVCHRW